MIRYAEPYFRWFVYEGGNATWFLSLVSVRLVRSYIHACMYSYVFITHRDYVCKDVVGVNVSAYGSIHMMCKYT